MRKLALIIETIGPPGAGKTTVRNYIINRLAKEKINVLNLKKLEQEIINKKYRLNHKGYIGRIIGKVFFYTIIYTNPIIRQSIISYPIENISKARRHRLYWYTRDLVITYYYQRLIDQIQYIYFPDEGIFQHFTGLKVFGAGNIPYFYQHLIDSIKKTNILLLQIILPSDECFHRLLARGIPSTWPFYYRTNKKIRIINKNYYNVINTIVNDINLKDIKIIKINTSGDFKSVQKLLDGKYTEIKSYLYEHTNHSEYISI